MNYGGFTAIPLCACVCVCVCVCVFNVHISIHISLNPFELIPSMLFKYFVLSRHISLCLANKKLMRPFGQLLTIVLNTYISWFINDWKNIWCMHIAFAQATGDGLSGMMMRKAKNAKKKKDRGKGRGR